MNPWQKLFCCEFGGDEESSGGEVEDRSAAALSYVGTAVYEVLRKKHNWHHHSLWNVTSGEVVGEIQQTPRDGFPREGDPVESHDDWFAHKFFELISKTEVWCDVMSLGPPDGIFMDKFKEALGQIADRASAMDRSNKITIRMMFGNIVGMPVNCTAVIKKLTEDLPANANIQLWVGAWRKGVSWNHAKIVAVDGRYLHTGGHNLWDYHYLKHDPVHDLSVELEGRITNDGHLFANEQWEFIEKIQRTCCGTLVDKMPDYLPLLAPTRVTVSEYPEGESPIFPPMFAKSVVPYREKSLDAVPMISIGRQGNLHWRARPSDDAFMAMLGSAKKIIKMALQDLGPVCIPGTKVTLPGCVWPKEYLSVLGRVIWNQGVDVEIILSNPNCIPGGLSATEANYGNGWSCVDVAAEIIKTIRAQFPGAKDSELRQKVTDNLRVCFLKDSTGDMWKDGKKMGLHSKHFIVDDICCYVGSQNLYICDLAEWGVVIDDEAAVTKIMEEYWDKIWKYSYTGNDCDVDAVMDGLEIDRDAEDEGFQTMTTKRKKLMEAARVQNPGNADEKAEWMFGGAEDEEEEKKDE